MGLERFLVAQERVYDRAFTEIASGRKQSHWMWFIFPQLRGLGRSERAIHFGLTGAEEAGQYLADPVLGPGLVGICQALLNQPNRDPEAVFGAVDAQKLRSSVTLFALLPLADPVFQQVLSAFFAGQPCPLTVDAVG